MTVNLHEALLEDLVVGQITGDFYVPAYQRGYRWGAVEVRRLLEDIWESRDKPYYLQPVVVKRYGEEWELVDGQQRLTTLFLIFQFMQNSGFKHTGARYSLRYETRGASAPYLRDPDPQQGQTNIDFFHISEAYQCISDWFGENELDSQYIADKLYMALFEHVRVIWYEAPADVDGPTLFTRLNVGRIPLTDAELVKALLLSRSRKALGRTDRALEVATQWDTIERDLRDPELWAFITAKATEEPTHISLLLDTLAGGPVGRDRPLFHTFETLKSVILKDPQLFWDRVLDQHSLVSGWYADRNLFHKVGYLIAVGVSFGELIERSRGKRKSVFEGELDGLIRDSLRLTRTKLLDLGYANRKPTSRALLLMNVETIRQRQHSSERYSFKEHALGCWSLEHIHAQNAERLNREEQWIEWLRLHSRVLATLDGVAPSARQGLLGEVDAALELPTLRESDFRPLERKITEMLSGDNPGADDVDSIANLALLHGGDNSALSNSVFAVKRAEVLERDRQGSYIPVCSRNAFLKYYTPADEQQMHFWSSVDRQHYVGAIIDTLEPYLEQGEVTA